MTPASSIRASFTQTTSVGSNIEALLTQVEQKLQQHNKTADPLVIYNCIQTFHNCISKLPPKRWSNAAFITLRDLLTDKNNRTIDKAPKRPNFNNKKYCVYGFNHLFQDCYYFNLNGINLPPDWKSNKLIILQIISTIKRDNKILYIVEVKFKLLSLELPDWWIKVITTATTMPPITILMHLVAANAVSNSLYTVNAANAIYKEEQWPELNITFTVTP